MIFGYLQGPPASVLPGGGSDWQTWVILLMIAFLGGAFFLVMRTYDRQVKEQRDHQKRMEQLLAELVTVGSSISGRIRDLEIQVSSSAEILTDTIMDLDLSHMEDEDIEDLLAAAEEESTERNGREEFRVIYPDEEEQEEEFEEDEESIHEIDGHEFPLDKALLLMMEKEKRHPENLLEACSLLRTELDGKYKKQASVALCEALFWLGDISTVNREKEKYHGEGVEIGKKAVELNDGSAAAHLWYAANMGSHGVARGIMSSLFYLGDIEKHGMRAIELDESFFHAAPLRLIGRFFHQCPGWPIGKGDVNKGIEYLRRAVDLGPDFMLNHYYLADALIAKRRKKEARELLQQLIDTKEFKVMPKYQANLQEQARVLLKKT
jgi:tetratricopeptide (TPR) repeat protein